MIEAGRPAPLGASWHGDGVNFAIYSGGAEFVELCLFDTSGNETHRFPLPDNADGVWYGYVAGCRPGQAYGYRVHGPYRPEDGLRYNANKLLIDPYARKLEGELEWCPAVFDFEPDKADQQMQFNRADSAPFVPKCVVTGETPGAPRKRPKIPWSETIIYEANVRGYTMRHPTVPEKDKGLFRGMRNGDILDYLKSLGITSLELMPVHAFIDEQFLHRHGLRNAWGYNTINFFAPALRYLGGDEICAFREMVDEFHDAGIEVILDVVYNHTGESDRFGPTLSFRGIDNRAYYRLSADDPAEYVNDTGCGNTINANHPIVRGLIIDSLRYWHEVMGVDGFRFDLAPVLGRSDDGFSTEHPTHREIGSDPVLKDLKLIAEPWDAGPGGYRLGGFPANWAEWNDRYRDAVRRFWRGDADQAHELAKRLHGSSDVFESSGRGPSASINFVTSHDGFTLADVVSYETRHNEANLQDNRDGHKHNYSCNYGVEGVTDDKRIHRLRRGQRLNMLATLLLSQGTPMLLAGDEFGNSQGGNNNAYAQDNDVAWLDWSGIKNDPEFTEQVRQLIQIRRETPLLRQSNYLHGQQQNRYGWPDIDWLTPEAERITDSAWHNLTAWCMLLTGMNEAPVSRVDAIAAAILFNVSDESVRFSLPHVSAEAEWKVVFSTSVEPAKHSCGDAWTLTEQSLAFLLLGP